MRFFLIVNAVHGISTDTEDAWNVAFHSTAVNQTINIWYHFEDWYGYCELSTSFVLFHNKTKPCWLCWSKELRWTSQTLRLWMSCFLASPAQQQWSYWLGKAGRSCLPQIVQALREQLCIGWIGMVVVQFILPIRDTIQSLNNWIISCKFWIYFLKCLIINIKFVWKRSDAMHDLLTL